MTDAKVRVFYNAACPVCDAGITAQKNKSTSCRVDWLDVDSKNSLVKELNADLEFVRERLHVVDTDGRLQIGFDAFLVIWQHSPTEQWKYRVFSWRPIRVLGRVLYNIFARCLYRWNRFRNNW